MSGHRENKDGTRHLSMFVKVVRPGIDGCAPLDVLRRRTYMRVLRLPAGRALIVGRLPL